MSYLFCESRSEAIKLQKQAESRVPAILAELSTYIRSDGEITVNLSRVWHGMYWSVEADLLYDGEIVRHYEGFDLLELELNELELAILMKQPAFTGARKE